MLVHIVLAVLSTAAPAASPAPSPTPPLKEIVHVRASAFCSQFAHHANSAIDSATRNDVALSSLISSLRSNAFAGNVISRNNEMLRLQQIADAITKDWRNGEGDVNELRKLAERATDPAEKKELKDSADALGGALWRQRKIARDLDGFVSYLHTRDMAGIDESQGDMNQALFGTRDARDTIRDVAISRGGSGGSDWIYSNPGLANEPTSAPISDQAAVAAHDFEQRIPDIVHDEINAAEHVTTASDNC